MILALAGTILGIGLLAFYVIVIRPILRSRHFADSYFAREENLWKALAGYRSMMAAYFVIFASVMVEAYDLIAPVVMGTDVTPILDFLPRWAWPLIWIAIGALFRWLRKITNKPEPSTAPILGTS